MRKIKNNKKYDEFAWKLVDYFKLKDEYEFRDCYENDIIAHDDLLRALKAKNGILMAMQQIVGDIEDHSHYNQDNMEDKEYKKFLDEAYKLHRELKKFKDEIYKEEKKKGKER